MASRGQLTDRACSYTDTATAVNRAGWSAPKDQNGLISSAPKRWTCAGHMVANRVEIDVAASHPSHVDSRVAVMNMGGGRNGDAHTRAQQAEVSAVLQV